MSYVNAPIHDLLIRIKNAYKARKTDVSDVQYSVFKMEVLNLLKQYGFVEDMSIREEGTKKFIDISLKPVVNAVDDVPVVKFYSKPSRPWYVGYKELKAVAWGRGIGILSTSAWLLPAHVAKKRKIWGELIAEIY
jgi:small subunit ribosomal protein S8